MERQLGDKKATERQKGHWGDKRLLERQKGHYGDKKVIRKTKGPIGDKKAHIENFCFPNSIFVSLMAFFSLIALSL